MRVFHSMAFIVTAILSFDGAPFASAAGPPEGGRGRARQACQAEIEEHCSEADDRRARRRCLEDHEDELSDACRQALESRGSGGYGRRGARRAGG